MTTSRIHILLTLFFVLTLFTLASCGGSVGGDTSTPTPTPNISVSPAPLDFTSVTIGTVTDRLVTVRNTGTADLIVGLIAGVDPLAVPFELVADNCSNQTLLQAGSCTVTIRYSPTLLQPDTDSFDIPSNDPDTATVTVNVSGNGIEVPIPNILASPDPLDFGDVLSGTTKDKLVTISNTGNADLLLGDIAVIDTLTVPFELVAGLDNCSNQTLIPAGSCTITIRYAPTSVQTDNDSFDIPSNDPDTATVTVNVSGTSAAPPPSIPNPITLDVDTFVISNSLTLGNNIDYWSFSATAGDVYSVEIIGTRLDQEGWQLGSNIPHIKILDPTGADLIEHHFGIELPGIPVTSPIDDPWLWGTHDLDIPMFYAEQTAPYYIAVSKEWPLDPGGQYAIRLTNVTPTTLVAGVEPAIFDVRDNNTQMILPGDTVLGRIDFPDEDNYAFEIINTPAIACFEVTGNRIGVETGENAYLDPSLTLYDVDDTKLADGQTDADIDDYIFSDPKLCYRFDTADTYFITVDTSFISAYDGSGDYFLDYTLVDSGFTPITKTKADAASAQTVISGDWVNSSINSTGTDWYTFLGTTGDMIRISYFDSTNSQSGTNPVTVTMCLNASCDPGNGTTILAADDPTTTGSNSTGPGAFTVRTILNAGSTSSHTISYSFLVTGSAFAPYSLKFEKFRDAFSGGGSSQTDTPNNTLEIRDFENINFGTNLSEHLDERIAQGVGYGAGSMNSTEFDRDTFQFLASAGQFITINVYADQPLNNNDMGDKVHDLSGHGSQFEPVLRVYASPNFANENMAIAVARFDPSQFDSGPAVLFDVAAEGVNDFLPTISLTFEAPEAPSTNIYYMSLEAERDFPDSTYFFEVIRHTNP